MLLRIILLVIAVACAGIAWFMSAGWIDPGNYGAWLGASLLPWERFVK